MRHTRTIVAAGAFLLTGIASAMAAPPAAAAWVSHFSLNAPATPSAPPTPVPFVTLLNTSAAAEAPVRAPYCTCVFGTMPGQYGSSRDFPPGPPVQQAE